MRAKIAGPLMIAIAALLWATDGLFRFPTVGSLDPTLIVMIEHAIGLLSLLPFVWLKHGKGIGRLGAAQWLAAAIIGIGGSAIATILFTASFRYLNPSVTILLQKLQPVIVVAVAYLVLGEKPKGPFFGWAALALASGVVLSFPDLDFSFVREGIDLRSRGVIYALSAAFMWAIATILGKVLLRKVPTGLATFWRYFFGLATASALVWIGGSTLPLGTLQEPKVVQALLYMGFVPGLAAMLAYYGGLSRTPASVTTFVELIFPISAVILNTVVLHTPLSGVQLAAGAVLLFAIAKISKAE